ncbi:MAG: rhodanese-like domain-containing protein [Acidobacteriales bacterium]|nr:rhodanese-like domain-containing protein [Terriglobales bacterium]
MNGREVKRVLVEAFFVAATGTALALAANFVSPRGLSITRNYFPGPAKSTQSIAGVAGSNVAAVDGKASPSPMDVVIARLRAKGLQPIDVTEARKLFDDPQYQLELIVFVDAREDRHYQEGHIPGAYQFDRYYPERYLPQVLPACVNAAKIVVYCMGDNCEDSEFAAAALRDAGVPQERLFVYVSGMTDWATNGLPVEIGGRKSGNLRGSAQ